jgi:acylphosphatase
MSASRVGRRLVVHGRVQGVWYRDSVRRVAERHDVAGGARNLADGTVEVVLEGEPEAVAAVEAYCREGPPDALVTRVDATDVEPTRARDSGTRFQIA